MMAGMQGALRANRARLVGHNAVSAAAIDAGQLRLACTARSDGGSRCGPGHAVGPSHVVIQDLGDSNSTVLSIAAATNTAAGERPKLHSRLWPLSPHGRIPVVRMLGRIQDASRSNHSDTLSMALGRTLIDLDELISRSVASHNGPLHASLDSAIRCPYQSHNVVGCGGNETHDAVLLFGTSVPVQTAAQLLGENLMPRLVFSAEAGRSLWGNEVWALAAPNGARRYVMPAAVGLGAPESPRLVLSEQNCAAASFGVSAAVEAESLAPNQHVLLWAACIGPPDLSREQAADVALHLPRFIHADESSG